MHNNIHTKKETGLFFTLPDELSAKTAPELRGVNRDRVKLLVADRNNGETFHSTFNHLPDFLRKGDLLVFNSSRTLPASLSTLGDKKHNIAEVRLAEHLPDDSWLVLLLNENKSGSAKKIYAGLKIEFETGLTAIVEKRDSYNPKLWRVKFSESGTELINIFYQIGQPIHYDYVSAPLPLEYYLTVFAKDPGSSEMPSAGRAFTWEMFFELKNKGIETAFLTLHTGLSSYMDDNLTRTPKVGEEEYFIPAGTVTKIQTTKSNGGRIIAVGTTVVRALESAASCSGKIIPGHSYTTLRITEDHVLKVANGLITGFHEPRASHLDLISAFLDPNEIRKIYEEAIERKYLWHEFGDLSLIL